MPSAQAVPTAVVGIRSSGYEGVDRGQLAIGTAPAVGITTEATARARRRHERPSAQM
jgi:hypothetical protein